MAVTPPASTAVQEEYSLFNQKGELIQKVMVTGTGNAANDMAQAQYRAGIAQEYVSTTAPLAVSPTLVKKP